MYKLLFAAVLLASTSIRAESLTTLTSGFDYSTGKYGTNSETTILYVPVTLKVLYDYAYFKLTIPYISVTSVGGVVAGIGPVKKTVTTKITTNSGLGDIVATAGYTVFENDTFALDTVANIKFGTADAGQSLGTGENDYSAQLDGFYTAGKQTWFATAGYKVIGVPAGTSLHNIFYGTLGASQKLNDEASAGAMLNAAQSSSDVTAGPLDVTVYYSKKTSKTGKVQFAVLKGFSDGSPDVGINVMFTGTM